MGARTRPSAARRLVTTAAVGVVIALLLSACESSTVNQANSKRAAAAVGALNTSAYLTTAARAHSAEMCANGAVAPTADIAASYLGEAATAIDELVGSAPLDPAITTWGARNNAAANQIWAQWMDDPTLVDPQWTAIGVGEHECAADGRLYSTLVLRDDPPTLAAPADTSRVEFVETVTQNGWKYDRYRNRAYPCSISGYQTFVIGTKVGSSATASRPMWVKMRGGGVGWFDDDGTPLPTAGVKSEESMTTQLGFDTAGLMANVKAGPEGFRILLVSMCSHDIYAGADNYDPYNANLTPDGLNRPTTGLTSTKAAIQFAQTLYPTNDYFLHGTSAGGVGVFHVAWALQQQGIPPTGVVSDSGVLNQAWQRYVAEVGISGSAGCEKATEERGYGVLGRISRDVGDPANEPHLLVSSGRLTVPAMHVWSHADNNVCGNVLIPCPVPDGSAPILMAADCNHEPMRLAIESLGATTASRNMAVCVEGGDTSFPCDRHVVTAGQNLVNTDPSQPADYQAAILAWVQARLADD